MSEMSEEILQGNSREERLKNFIAWFPEEEKAEWNADDYVDENGRHSMTFEEYVSHRLDMIETDVSRRIFMLAPIYLYPFVMWITL